MGEVEKVLQVPFKGVVCWDDIYSSYFTCTLSLGDNKCEIGFVTKKKK